MFKRHIYKSKFRVCYQFFRYENPRRKNFVNPSCPKHPKIIEIKYDIIFYFHTSFGASESFHEGRQVRAIYAITISPPLSWEWNEV